MKKLLFLFCAVTFLVSCDDLSTRGPKVGSKESMTAAVVTSDTDVLEGLKLGSRILLKSYTSTEKPAQTSAFVLNKFGSPKCVNVIIPIVNDFDPKKVVQVGTMENGRKIFVSIIRNSLGNHITFSLKNDNNSSSFMGEIKIPPNFQQPIELIVNKISSSWKIMEVKDN
jgi:hypothetical protein